ncbi:YVTN family beta-propeller protein [Caldicoprobacter guelmensis]|uniref:YncE family protein n=1 Tax=Caldicoprobacter guelmensis TaxID=1170224 RepID=UPI00195BBDA4|nr:hypothetical protein [Caldicoprobacter guelmensis]MBM7583225.1 YVTN family beta-propeller protein [Caldicoprobacter guelmensis]
MMWHGKIAVANKGEDSISFLNPHRRREEYRIYLEPGVGPCALAKMKSSPILLVVQAHDNSLACIDLDCGVVEKILPVGRCPSFITVCNKTHTIYVTNADSDSISVVHNGDDLKVMSQVPVGSMPQGIDCHHYLPLLAIAHMDSQDIWFVETEGYTMVKRIAVGGYPIAVKFSSKGNTLYVGCYFHNHRLLNKVLLVDLCKHVVYREIAVGCMPHRLLETSDGRYLLVASCEAGNLEVVDLVSGSVVHRVKVGEAVGDMALDEGGVCAYVTAPYEGRVCVVDWKAGKKLADIQVGKKPSGIVYLEPVITRREE